MGRQIYSISESSAWWLGDWLIYGQAQYPGRYKRAIAETSLDYQTLRNYAWVARQFSAPRRRPTLSFQHHAELASLPEDVQDQWLDRAEKFGWSRNELRNRVRASRNATPIEGSQAEKTMRLQVNVVTTRKQRWQEAAASADQDLVSWMVAILDKAASASLAEKSA